MFDAAAIDHNQNRKIAMHADRGLLSAVKSEAPRAEGSAGRRAHVVMARLLLHRFWHCSKVKMACLFRRLSGIVRVGRRCSRRTKGEEKESNNRTRISN